DGHAAQFFHPLPSRYWWAESLDSFVASEAYAKLANRSESNKEKLKASLEKCLAIVPSQQAASTAPPMDATVSDRPRLFFLGVGVSKYKYPEYNLKFAASDVQLVRS